MAGGGFEVTAFPTAREGLDALQQSAAELLLVDTDLLGSGSMTAREMLGDDPRLAYGRGASDRARWSACGQPRRGLDLGADNAVSRPWDAATAGS